MNECASAVREHFGILPLLFQAERLFEHGLYKEALGIAKRCLLLAPTNAELLNFAGVCALKIGDPVGAEDFLLKAAGIERAYAAPQLNLGLVCEKQNRME